jgi:hypothetical protein
MSVLSFLSFDFIKYLSKNDINLQTYQTETDDIKRGFWSILYKNERSYMAQISYIIYNKKLLSVSWIWYSENKHKREKIRHISYLVMLYFLFIYFKKKDGMKISCREFDKKLFGKNKENKDIKDCFLCKNKSCILCTCKHDIMNMITTMYDKNNSFCFDHEISNIYSKFRSLRGLFIKDSIKDYKFVNDYMDENRYILCTQDILDTGKSMEGFLTVFKKKRCIGDVEFRMDDNSLYINVKTCKKTTIIKIIILHLLSVYQSDFITIKITDFHKKISRFCNDIGFRLHNDMLTIKF